MKNRFLLLFLLGSLVLVNGCQKEYSFEGGAGPSEGTLQDDGSGDCLPKTVAGTYVIGTALNGTNYIEVQVNVTLAGSYSIHTDTVNGIHFNGAGVFTATGLITVKLAGSGTPTAAGIHNFVVSYGISGCTISVTTSSSLASFTLNGAPGACLGATPGGTYTAGTALNASNTATINVNVTALGAYTISTAASNGITFSGSGVFTTLGAQAIVLTGSGTPVTAGSTNIPVTAGSSSCSFSVTVVAAAAPATFSVTCTSAVVNGTYTVGTPLGASNTVSIGVNVATAGSYNITSTVGGMTFAASGTFAATGTQTVTLTGSGTPTTSGANTVAITAGTAPCNFTVTVVAGAGAATFAVNCASAVVNGTYKAGVALTAANTVTISVNVATPGTYTINTTLTNGMTFTASGNFAAAGTQSVTLTGSGTPIAAGTNSIPVPTGTTPCNFSVTVTPATGGAAVFAVDCFSAIVNGLYAAGTALGASNTVTIDVNVTTPGTYTITTTATNGMTFSATGSFAAAGIQTVTLTGTGTPTSAGTFTIPVPSGTTPCSFDVDVDPAPIGSWSFKEGTTTYSGIIDDALLDPTAAPPFLVLYFSGPSAAGHYFEIDLIDINGTIANGENYNAAVFTGTANTGIFYFEGPPPASTILYQADPTIVPNTMLLKVTTHNTATKTVTGTFSGTAQDAAGNPKAITNGVFTVTYP